MNFYIGITDNDWFNYLKARMPDEVNFWRPGAQTFSALKLGEPFLFKLHAPRNYIVGGGFFVRYTRLPLSLVWKVFEKKNGVDSFADLAKRIRVYLADQRREIADPEIGCIILGVPFFFEREDWIPAPDNWSSNIVSGKGYSTEDAIGAEIWGKVELLLNQMAIGREPIKKSASADERPAYGSEYLVRARLGQGGFRTMVIDAYQRRCAVSGEKTIPVLEAAHIKPFAESGPNAVSNGLLLRADLHILFDQGYISVTDDYDVEVSRRIREEYENGRDYYRYNGQKLAVLPHQPSELPDQGFLAWHRENLYKG